MKKLLVMILLAMASIVHSQDEFEVQGQLTNADLKTDIIVYVVDTAGLWTCRDTTTFSNTYHMMMSTNETYLLRFTSSLGDKYLWLELDENPGYYTMNVNFEWTTHGVVYYNQEFQKYVSYLVTNDQVQELFYDQ
jgi:hypothetical protein